MLGKAPDIRRFEDRMGCLATIGALGAVNFPGHFPIEIMDRNINAPDREIRSLEKAAECPVGLFALFRELLNSLDVGFKFHISASLTNLQESHLSRNCLFYRIKIGNHSLSLKVVGSGNGAGHNFQKAFVDC